MTSLKTKKSFAFLVTGSVFFKILITVFLVNMAQAQAAPAPESFADLAEKLLPTVVNISSTQKVVERQQQIRPFQVTPNSPQFPDGHPYEDFFNDFFGQQLQGSPQQEMPATSMGSGFIIDKDKGLIITNSHVIAESDDIKVTLHNDKILSATVVGVDEKTDIALLKVDLKNEDVSAAKFGDSDIMRVGDWVIAIGNPFGLGGTVTAGIISARKRDIQSGPYDDYIQTDASINRGNSGGPMFNMKGEVIGINTAIFSPTGGSVGIGFAIPSVMADSVVKQLNEFGRTRRGWLGVKIQDVTEEIAESLGLAKAGGALVAEVTPTGPAEKAGIQAGDIILAFDNKPVREMRNLPRIVAETDINKDVDVILWRGGKRVTLKANIGELEKAEDDGLLAENDGDNQNGAVDDKVIGTEFTNLGLTLNPLTDVLKQKFAIDSSVDGLIVLDMDMNGEAAKQGISIGDVIVKINQKPATVEGLQDDIDQAKKTGREAILFLLNHQGSMQFVAVKLKEPLQDVAPEAGKTPAPKADHSDNGGQ